MSRVNGIGFFKMKDRILREIFLDTELWSDALQHGLAKGIPTETLEYIQSPIGRADLCKRIATGEYVIAPPHTGYTIKDDGTERTYFVNKPLDRILLNVVNKWLARNENSVIHECCLSYKEHVGIGKIVKNVSHEIRNIQGTIIGRKFDIHSYFDNVPVEYIHQAFDLVECDYGKSTIISLLRNYFNSNLYYDSRLQTYCNSYHGLKQGCAVSSWLANVVLYKLDCILSDLKGVYVRYSDDILFIGERYEEATQLIESFLRSRKLVLNKAKTINLHRDNFFPFLGYDIKENQITLSKKWLKRFQQDIDKITIRNNGLINKIRNIRRRNAANTNNQLDFVMQQTIRRVVSYLYYGNGEYSWATAVLPVVNCIDDLQVINQYCMDAIRAVYTGKTHIGGLGKTPQGKIVRGKGRNVRANRLATSGSTLSVFNQQGWINGYLSIHDMHKIISNRWLYKCLVRDIINMPKQLYSNFVDAFTADTKNLIPQLEEHYTCFLYSKPDGKKESCFYAKELKEMNIQNMIAGANRTDARESLESFIKEKISFSSIVKNQGDWFWQSENIPELVLLRKWFE